MLYTLRIEKAGAAALDGTTLLNLAATGVTVDRTTSGEIVVVVPDGVALGRIDPGAVLEAAGVPSGRTFIAEQVSAVSDGGAYPGGGGDIVERTTPLAGAFENVETILDLSANNGLPSADRRIFMHDHAMAFTTSVAGPHVLSVLIKPVEDEDLEGSAVDGPDTGEVQVNGQLFTPPVALLDAALILVDASRSLLFTVTLAGNRTLDIPSNLRAGATYTFVVTQDGGGAHTLAYDAAYLFPGGVAPVVSAGAGDVSILTCLCDDGATLQQVAFVADLS